MSIFHKHKWYTVGTIRAYVYKWCSKCGEVQKIFDAAWKTPDVHPWEKVDAVPKKIADKINEFKHIQIKSENKIKYEDVM